MERKVVKQSGYVYLIDEVSEGSLTALTLYSICRTA